MRYCRYVKQDKDPFTDSIYNEIVQKRAVCTHFLFGRAVAGPGLTLLTM